MPKTSKQCRYGSNCTVQKCTLKHPPKTMFDYSDEPPKPVLNDDGKDSVREDTFIDECQHLDYINELSSAIVYTGWTAILPYAIETFPELGTFPTWDSAFDALCNYMYLGIGETCEDLFLTN